MTQNEIAIEKVANFIRETSGLEILKMEVSVLDSKLTQLLNEIELDKFWVQCSFRLIDDGELIHKYMNIDLYTNEDEKLRQFYIAGGSKLNKSWLKLREFYDQL